MRRSSQKTRVTDARRFKRLTDVEFLSDATQGDIDRFVALAREAGYAERTTHGTICSIERLTSRKFVKPRFPDPPVKYIPPLADLGRLYESGDSWVQRFLAIAYTTGLRLADLRELREDQLSPDRSELRLIAAKTTREMVIPIPPSIRDHFDARPIDWDSHPRARTDSKYLVRCGKKQLYARLKAAASEVGVPYASPHAIRRLSACQYETAYPGAGRAILGHRATVTGRYIPDVVILRRAQERLVIPWGPMDRRGEEQFLEAWGRLSLTDRETIFRMIIRMNQ